MSKPVTNEEVEDVLSSIRRLVSEDKRPLAGLRNAPTDSSQNRPAGLQDKLVLTPALRVAETPAKPADEGPLDLGRVARQIWNIAGAKDSAPSTDPDTSPDEVAHEVLDRLPDDIAPEAPFSDDYRQDDAEQEAGFDTLDALVQDALAEEVAQVDAAAEPNDEAKWRDVAPMHGDDLDENDTSEGADREADGTEGPAPDVHDDSPAEPFEARTDDMAEQNQAEIDATVPLTAKIAALETAIDAIRQDWEPDGAGTGDYAAAPVAAMAWEDDIELDATGSPLNETQSNQEQTDTASATPPPVSGGQAGDDSLMDEEALRDLVSEIVRAELQGALGERITRNVRKLVRREIHRALTAQELE